MKKLILSSMLSIFVGGQAWALSDIEISGEADLNALVHLLPTGQAGETNFRVPSLLLNFSVPLKEGNLLYVSFEGAQKLKEATATTAASDSFSVNTREAYLELVSIFEGASSLRMGVIPDSWLESHYEDVNYRFLGETAWGITEKWKYQHYSDLGLEFMSEMPWDLGEWSLSVVNGEGRKQDNSRAQKEGSLFLRFTSMNPVVLSLQYIHGTYEAYGDDVGAKERIQASFLYKPEDSKTRIGIELLDTHDPADAITDYEMADSVDVSALAGQAVHGFGGSAYTIFGMGPKGELMLRYDYLDAAVGESDKTMQTGILSFAYQVTEDVKTALAVDHTWYAQDYGKGIRDASKVELAAQVLF
ncbi:hypothetical protein B9G69_004275 [Bdellovibrio sp. SKB1291214]|uniref:hypothetical protein n=1 Tax=Bdellovibrio sp. SKB1291214 TaxID=1732569 RepID=UPI00223FD264|nr:hypothetical protein [Bdellovibrio sp. SKB1291214]UYL09790.1 hypothetical protein B9G69_004275 [Bdellovibrio sp. SKB1291214]